MFGIAKDLGLCKTKDSSSYDVFKNRIIFPIHNEKGTIVGFGGRRSNAVDVLKFPKYINSSASLIYDKSKVLYGLFQAKQSISKTGTAILTEGYTDVMSLHQNGYDNAVASCGTALTEHHAKLLKKYATEVILLRDSDTAGLNAMLKKGGDIDTLLSIGLSVSICLLPDGEDPDSFSRKSKDIAKWINENKKDALIYKALQYDFVRDRYETEVAEIKESVKKQVKALEDTLIDTTNLQGDELKQITSDNKLILEDIKNLKKEGDQEIKSLIKIDPNKKSQAVTEISESLFKIKNEIKRTEYIKQISKLLGVTVSSLKAEIGKFELRESEKNRERNDNGLAPANVQLPEGANQEEYREGHGFVTTPKGYYFLVKDNVFIQGTNFKLEPLFHIQGDKENKRLCEITNNRGKKKLVDFDSDMLANFSEFRKYLFRIGGFTFLTHNGIRTEHFDKFVYRYEQQFEPALELLTLGWNKKGFFAFANGVFWEGKFRNTNKYGIIKLDGIDQTTSEYNQKIDNYYSPAFSVMHNDNQEGDDKYENDRYFVFKESTIDLQDWMQQVDLVFGDRGKIGILFCFGAMFRDVFLSLYDFFPLLGGFGEKDSGKSGFGKILQNFFYFRLPPLDLTQATHVGFSRRLSRVTNTVQFCDEYQDKNVKEDVFNGLMGSWNGIGREKGSGVGTNRTTYDKVNSAIYYAGQFMPTRMENALATRTVSLFFKNKNYSPEEKTNYAKLLRWTNEGVSSLTTDILQHRQYFTNALPKVHPNSERTLKELLKDEQYQERIFGNVAVLFSTYQILKDKIEFPADFTEEKIKELCVKLIVDNSEQIADSNGLTSFWNIVTFLYERAQITDGFDFVIDNEIDIKILGEKRKEIIHKNANGDQILYLRLKSVYQYYNKEATTREGVDVIGETTLRNYFKSRPYFIGLIKSKRFKTAGSQSCYAFNYTMMKDKGLVFLEKDESADFGTDNNILDGVPY